MHSTAIVDDGRLWSIREAGSTGQWLDWFWSGFVSVMDRRGNELFSQSFPAGCEFDSEHVGGFASHSVNRIIREYIPSGHWPPVGAVTMDQVFDYVEFFYLRASSPSRYDPCGWDDNRCPTDFDSAVGRREYEDEINRLFERFAAPYRLTNGRISRALSSTVEHVIAHELDFPDAHLNGLIQKALEAFTDRKDRRIEAVMLLATAYEHLKSLEHGNIKTSVMQLLDKVAKTAEQKTTLNTCMQDLTNICHVFVRHSRKDGPSVDDPEFAETIFVILFSIFSLVHKRVTAHTD